MTRRPRHMLRATALLASAALTLAPLSAQTARNISPSDKATGAKANPELIAEFGGAVTGPQATYVAGIGKNIAIQSGLSNARDDFTVTLLNSPVNNAFAIPGGYVYTTRQLVALMNNEAELAGVLGHEVGHVAARHSKLRQKAATRNSILGVLGQVLGSVVGGGFGNVIAQGSQFGAQALTASFSRAQETQADNLGIQYMRGAGYDPRALSTVLQSLANQTALDARLMGTSGNRVPEWASTHPDPASRVRAALVRAGPAATGIVNRDAFLSRIDGIMYGDDPKQGVVEGNRFTHPEFRLTFQAPNGFYVMNGTRAVSIGGGSGKAEFSSAAYNGNLETYIRSVFAGLGSTNQAQIPISQIERTTVNGIPAAYGVARVASGGSQVDVVVFAYEFSNGQAYHFTTLSPAGQSGTFDPMFRSLRRISASEAAAIKPRRIAIVTVRSSDTVRSLASRMAYSDYQVERFLVLNGLTANAAVSPGQKVKLVIY
ncbi:M48 family metalloprotease [Novosphingobium sp. Gsoil 351]|uniref:M48 family metalloprotease n=1 Tax=Novosphingobium sp. Gsoil 351 TaxID=2675225 RepID=UPI0012B4ED04|nr:M48 family metalloprotease [Novosphingobium sp. Gsoil 351]QGN53712.1 M48 family metalloprotease [Novosphingobium sp. Gsoil 351]